MKLIASLGSPFVRKVRIVMAEKKIDYDLLLDDPWSPDSLIQQSNPLGKVPCLMMDDGGAMFDSRVIVEYLDILTPVGKLIPVSGRERAEVKCWEALADGIVDAGVMLRLEKKRPAAHQSDALLKRQRGKIDVALRAMSEGLADKPFCVGTHYSLADVATGCALDWLTFRFPDIAWREDYPELAKLLDKLSERQSFKDTVPQ
ncbi:MAG TPA: glutathione S-transferase N-terminal domain-containing protein [Herbaspirillum sp.]|jgi:glutathione S-transferase